MNLVFAVTGFTSPHPPSVCTAITSAAQLLSGVVQALLQPQLWGNLNAEDDDGKARDGKTLLSTDIGIVFTLLLIVGSATYGFINTTQAPPRIHFFFFFFFFFFNCVWKMFQHGFLGSSFTLRWGKDGELCTCGVPGESFLQVLQAFQISHENPMRYSSKRPCWSICSICCFKTRAMHAFPSVT